MRADITITNIPTIMGIMDVMAIAMVITHPLDLATVTEEAIMAVIRLMDGIMAVVIEAVTAVAFMVAGLGAFMVVIDKSRNGNDEIKRIL
jgi:hypothetical protein